MTLTLRREVRVEFLWRVATVTISCYIAFFRRQEITHDEIPFLSGEKEQAGHERDSTGGD